MSTNNHHNQHAAGAVIYCRVSTVKQAERNELNLPAQQRRCEDWCTSQNIPVLRVFVAEGESAWKTERPTLQEAIDYIKGQKGKVTHFVVQDSTRFSRNVAGKALAERDLGKLGVKLVSVDEPMVDDSPMGKLAGTMATAFGEFYSHNLSSRVRYRFQLHREQGRWLHQAPLGYRNVQQPGGIKSLEPDEAAPLVRQAFEMMNTGGHSSDVVRQFVTAAGLRTKKNRKLTRQTFSFMLKNPVYCGLILHKGKTYKGSFPPIVSEELWQSVQDTLRGKRKAVPKKTVDDNFPLRGFVKCGYCRAKLTSGNVKGRSKTYSKYWCWNKGCEHPVSVSREKLEADWLYYLTSVQPAFDALVNVIPVLARANAQKRIADAEQKQRHLATQLSEREAMRLSIFESFSKGNLTQPEFRRMMDMIAADIAGIEAAQRAFVAEAEAVLQVTADTSRTNIPVKALWASAHLTEKLTVQNALFPDGILYRKDIGFFAPPDNEVAAIVFRTLISIAAEPDWEEIKSGRGDWI
jgi:site-specific DNA recombinase